MSSVMKVSIGHTWNNGKEILKKIVRKKFKLKTMNSEYYELTEHRDFWINLFFFYSLY